MLYMFQQFTGDEFLSAAGLTAARLVKEGQSPSERFLYREAGDKAIRALLEQNIITGDEAGALTTQMRGLIVCKSWTDVVRTIIKNQDVSADMGRFRFDRSRIFAPLACGKFYVGDNSPISADCFTLEMAFQELGALVESEASLFGEVSRLSPVQAVNLFVTACSVGMPIDSQSLAAAKASLPPNVRVKLEEHFRWLLASFSTTSSP